MKETNKCLTSLADLNIKPGEGGPRLISDSQTCLSLCSRPSSTLELSTSLVVSRVQETFGYKNLFYLPGSYFSTIIDLLTRYDVKILSKISQDFFQPPFLMPELFGRKSARKDSHYLWTHQRVSINRKMGATMERKMSGSMFSLWICRFVKGFPEGPKYTAEGTGET